MEVIKQLRQREIRDLLTQRPIRTQQELAAALRERGFRATQATISRDVAELGLVKASQDGVLTYVVPARVTEAESTGEERLRALAPRPAGGRARGRSDARPADAARLGARRSPRRWTAPAGPRSSAASPATTPSSSHSPTASRCSGSAADWRACGSSRRRSRALAGGGSRAPRRVAAAHSGEPPEPAPGTGWGGAASAPDRNRPRLPGRRREDAGSRGRSCFFVWANDAPPAAELQSQFVIP